MLTIVQTALQHSIDDRLQSLVHGFRFIRVLYDGHTLLDVEINALGDDRLHILIPSVNVEQFIGSQSIGQSILEGTQMVKHLGGNQRRQLVLTENLVFVQHFTGRRKI